MLKGVVFDFNGTLFFDSDYHFQVFDRLKMELRGEHLTMKEMESTYAGMPNVEIFRHMSDGRLTRDECEGYSKRKEAMYRDLVAKTAGGAHLCDGAEEMFDLLKEKGIPFTIASASIKENIDFFVETFHLDHWMNPDRIVYDDGSYPDKHDMFKEAYRRIGAEDHLLVFEDSLSGIRCASDTGAQLIVIDRDSLKEYYGNCPAIIERVDNLKQALPAVRTLIES